MKNEEYWKKRAEAAENETQRVTAEYIAAMKHQFEKAAKEVEDRIRIWYSRFMENNDVSLAEARKMLTSSELEELRWDVEDYIKHGEEYGVDGSWAKELENASARYHISRLEAIELQIRQKIEELYAEQTSAISDIIRSQTEDGYYREIFDIQQYLGAGSSFSLLSNKDIQTVISAPWAADGANFSDRIWKHKQELVREVNNIFVQSVAQGKRPNTFSKELAKRFEVKEHRAETLIRTEAAHFRSEGQRMGYEELDVEEYVITATLDYKTSEICQEMDGKRFPVSEMQSGVNAPPFHPNCRTATMPYIDDEYMETSTRAARDPEKGDYYQVPANMTYEEWKASLTEKQTEAYAYRRKVAQNRSVDKRQYEEYKEVLGAENLPKNLDEFQELKYNNNDGWTELKEAYRYVNAHDGADMNAYRCVKELRSLFPRGSFHIPAKPLNTNTLSFDSMHINDERAHRVTKTEAVSFINNAKVSHTVWQGQYERYYSDAGASYVNVKEDYIRTAFKAAEYDESAQNIMKVVKKYGY